MLRQIILVLIGSFLVVPIVYTGLISFIEIIDLSIIHKDYDIDSISRPFTRFGLYLIWSTLSGYYSPVFFIIVGLPILITNYIRKLSDLDNLNYKTLGLILFILQSISLMVAEAYNDYFRRVSQTNVTIKWILFLVLSSLILAYGFRKISFIGNRRNKIA